MQNDPLTLFKQRLSIPEVKQKLEELEKVDCPVTHHFAKGQYVRECFMPAGAIVLGKKHRESTVNVLLQGSLIVYNGEDSELTELKAPCVYTTDAGVQKLAYILSDVIWLNCFPTEETDPLIIEDQVSYPEEDLMKCH